MLLTDVNIYPANVYEALESLNKVTLILRRNQDNRAIFAEVYSTMTYNVARKIKENPTFFREAEFINQLSAHFASRYLQTLLLSVSGRPQDCGGWQLAYAYAPVPGKLPLVHALLGVSAHINYDLALSAEFAIRKMGWKLDAARLASIKHDYDAINKVLETALPRTLDRLEKNYNCSASALFMSKPWHKWTNQSIIAQLCRWRGQAWQNVEGLLKAANEVERKFVLNRMDKHTVRQSQMVLKLDTLQLVTPLFGAFFNNRTFAFTPTGAVKAKVK